MSTEPTLKKRNQLLIEAYFSSGNTEFLNKLPYSIPLWHLEMLKDENRLHFYNQVIKENVKGKIVLDVGSGSGILSHLAVKHGAKKVYSVEMMPVFQDVYSVLMEKNISEGKAKLIQKDAKDLTTQDFDDGLPEIVLHEIFGSNVFAEDIVQVFQTMDYNNILTNVSKFIPEHFKLLAEGIICDAEIEIDYKVNDFEGYPLSKLTKLGMKDHRYWEYADTKSMKVEKLGTPQVIYESTLPDFSSTQDLVFKLEGSKRPTHIRTWMHLQTGNHTLVTHHDLGKSHWTNSIFELPKSIGPRVKEARFTVKENQLTFSGCF